MFNKYKKISAWIAILAMIFSIFPQNCEKVHAETAANPITSADATTIATGFSSPGALTVATDGSIYVVDKDTITSGSIKKIDSSGNVIIAKDGFTMPNAVAVDRSSNIYVTGTNNGGYIKEISNGNVSTVITGKDGFDINGSAVNSKGDIYYISSNGGYIKEVNSNDFKIDMTNPFKIVIDAHDNMYALSEDAEGNSKVYKINSEDKSANPIKITNGIDIGTLDDMAVDDNGNIYVTNDDNCIYKIDSNGNCTQIGTEFDDWISMAVDANGKNIYLTYSEGKVIALKAPTITTQPTAKTVTAGDPASFSVTATGSAISYQWQKDKVDISGATSSKLDIQKAQSSDAGNYTVEVSNTLGTVTSSAVTLAVNSAPGNPTTVTTVSAIQDINVVTGTTIGAIGLPQNVSITLSDNTTTKAAVVWDNGSPKYDGSTAQTYTFTGTITAPSGVTNPNNIQASEKVIVSSTPPISSGNYVYRDIIDNGYLNLRGIDINGNDKYVVSCPNITDGDGKIYKYTADGKAVSIITGLNYPTSVVATGSAIYVVDGYTQDPKVLKYDSNGGTPVQIGSKASITGSNEGKYSLPYSIDVDNDGNVYITDLNLSKILKFNADGSFNKEVSCDNGLYGVAVDRKNGCVYVTETEGQAVKKYNLNLEEQTISGSEWINLRYPGSLTVDGTGNIFTLINDPLLEGTVKNCVKKFDTNGKLIATFGETGTGNGQFNGDGDIAVDNEGNVYVTDVTNRIQRFSIAATGKTVIYTAIGSIGNGNVINVPRGTKVSDFKAALKVSAGALVEIVDASGNVVTDQANTNVADTMKVKVTAEDKSSAEYSISVTTPAATPAYTVQASAESAAPTAGSTNEIKLIVKDSNGNADTNFTGEKNVTITGYKAAPNGSYGDLSQQSYGSLNIPGVGCGSGLGSSLASYISSGNLTTPTATKVSICFYNGVAYATLTLNDAAAQNIVFSVEGVNTPTASAITITPVPAAAKSMTLTKDITSPASNGGKFANQPEITLKDQYLNVCANNNSTQITAAKKDSGAWTLTGTTTAAAIGGIVNFTDLGATNAAAVKGAQLAFSTEGLAQTTSSAVDLPVTTPSSSGGSSSSSSDSSSSSNTVTGNVVEGNSQSQVSNITANVTTDSSGNKTVSMKASEVAALKAPDGTVSGLTDVSKLSITADKGTPVTIAADGTVKIESLAKGTTNNFNLTYDLGNGQKIVIGTMEVKVGTDGKVGLQSKLIDPYGIITDVSTGKAIEGANVTLYYANTDRNKKAGITPDTEVKLPAIDGFKPNNNKNPQVSDKTGAYGFMVFPNSDYYIAATKDGYHKYVSATISVEKEIVKWDFRMNPSSEAKGVQRLAGQNRIDTALSIAKATYPSKVSNVVLVGSEDYPDALSGSVLAYKLNAPMLLIGSSDEDKQKVLSYMKSNMDSTGSVYMLGGEGVLSKDFEGKVKATGFSNITRLGGADRYETSEKIAEKLNANKETPVVITSGENYPDALSISSIAAVNQYPILLVRKDEISDTVKKEISAINPTKVFIIGLQGSVSSAVESSISQMIPIEKANITRIGGKDRYETSLEVAKYFNLTGNASCIATGNNFADALAGSIYGAKYNAPIILVDEKLSDNESSYLKSSKLSGATIFGGEGVVNKNIEQQISQIVGK